MKERFKASSKFAILGAYRTEDLIIHKEKYSESSKLLTVRPNFGTDLLLLVVFRLTHITEWTYSREFDWRIEQKVLFLETTETLNEKNMNHEKENVEEQKVLSGMKRTRGVFGIIPFLFGRNRKNINSSTDFCYTCKSKFRSCSRDHSKSCHICQSNFRQCNKDS